MTATLPKPGELFEDGYRLQRVLGEGGFGTVYEAAAIKLDRTVAIKVLKPTRGGDATKRAARFLREVGVVANLTHPNTVTLFDHGQSEDGLLYMVTEFIDGDSLGTHLACGRRFSERECVHVLEQLLGSLQEAHEAGVLHRDIKPDNLILYEHFEDPLCVKLLDFGIAKLLDDEDVRLTGTGKVIGTPRYMSLDQLLGLELSPASDLYSVGLLAYDMLLGRDARSIRDLGNPPTLSERDRVGGDLRAIINRLLAPLPDNRYQSATEVLRDLRRPKERRAFDLSPRGRGSGRQTADAEEHSGASSRTAAYVGLTLGVAAIAVVSVVWVTRAGPRDSHRAFAPSPGSVQGPTSLLKTGTTDVLPVAADTGPVAADTRAPPRAVSPRGSSGCGRSSQFTGRGLLTHVDGLQAEQRLAYVPTTYSSSEPLPLVLILHDRNNRAEPFFDGSGFIELAESERFVVVSPQAPFGAGAESHLGEVELIARQVAEAVCIDLERIFVVGQGQGGWTAQSLACEDWVAGTASHAHRRGREGGPHYCEDAPPRPYLALHPRHSRHEPFEGGPSCDTDRVRRSVATVEGEWRERNGCTGPARETFRYRGSVCYGWRCTEAPFQSCHLEGGHRWPGMPPRRLTDMRGCDGPPTDFPAARVIWDFFDSLPAGGGGELTSGER